MLQFHFPLLIYSIHSILLKFVPIEPICTTSCVKCFISQACLALSSVIRGTTFSRLNRIVYTFQEVMVDIQVKWLDNPCC